MHRWLFSSLPLLMPRSDHPRAPRNSRPPRGADHSGPRGPHSDRESPRPPHRTRQPHTARPDEHRDPSDIGLGVRLVHEDDDVIVIDKPTGLVTAAMPGTPDYEDPDLRDHSAFAVVKHYIKDKRRQRGTRIWIIHRLDKEASGLIVFAASDRAYTQLKEEFRTKRAHRLYMAVVEGDMGHDAPSLPGRTPQAPSGIIRSALAEGSNGLMQSVRQARRNTDDDPGQLAVTHWRAVAIGNSRTLLQVRLDTGRKNQIRVHMKEAGHSLVGDRRYGGKTNPIARLCLHATELGFTHPATGSEMKFYSPAPQAFYGLVGETAPPNTIESRPSVVGAPPAPPKARDKNAAETSWDHVAEWYDQLIGERKSDHHENVIVPGVLRLLRPREGLRVLDVACGQGDFCRRLAVLGVESVGIDASPRLIEAANAAAQAAESDLTTFITADARALDRIPDLEPNSFDAAVSIMALMNIDAIDSMFAGLATLLKPGGAFTFVILHPAFRAPGQTSWGWAKEEPPEDRPSPRRRTGGPPPSPIRQYRRVDGYLSTGQAPIIMNPGKVARGAEPITTWTFHRPLQVYAKLLSEAGFAIEALEEWASVRSSSPGPRAAEENRARREIPMFLAIRAVLVPKG